jgi:hypothetical protein
MLAYKCQVKNEMRFHSLQMPSFQNGVCCKGAKNCVKYFAKKCMLQINMPSTSACKGHTKKCLKFDPQFYKNLKTFQSMQLRGGNAGPLFSEMYLLFMATLQCKPFWKLGILV